VLSTPYPRFARRVLAGLLALAPAQAFAHGGTWRADQVLVEPGNPSRVVLASDAWGVIETQDHGATWGWVCAEAYGAVSFNVERVPMVLLPGGTLLATRGFDGLYRAEGSLCDPAPVGFFTSKGRCGAGDCIAVDVARGSDSAGAALVLTTSARAQGGVANLLWHSSDAGRTWVGLPDTVPSDVAANSIAVAPSDPKKIYVAALPTDTPDVRVVLHTEDGGATWKKSPAVEAAVANGDSPPTLRVVAVHPTDARVAFFRLDAADVPPQIGADRLLVSTDGGATLRPVFQAIGNLPGFAFSADGATVFVAGALDGVHRGSLSEITAKGASAFVQVNKKPAWGLAVTGEGLVAGYDDFGVATEPRFSLGLSRDEGVTFSPLMVICDVGMEACPAGTQAANQCPAWFSGPGNYEYDFPDSVRCTSSRADAGSPTKKDGGAGGATGAGATGGAGGEPLGLPDAGSSSSGGKSSAGCGCTVAAAERPSSWLGASLGLVLLSGRRRARRR
jgi:hypothetical protein